MDKVEGIIQESTVDRNPSVYLTTAYRYIEQTCDHPDFCFGLSTIDLLDAAYIDPDHPSRSGRWNWINSCSTLVVKISIPSNTPLAAIVEFLTKIPRSDEFEVVQVEGGNDHEFIFWMRWYWY